MDWILIPALLAFFASGLYFMKQLDRFWARRRAHAAEEADPERVVLLFGGTEPAKEMETILSHERIPCLHISEESEIDRGLVYRYVFALSGDDLDNIMICRIGERILGMPKNQMVSLCNRAENRKIFEEKDIPYRMRGTDAALFFTNFQGENRHA